VVALVPTCGLTGIGPDGLDTCAVWAGAAVAPDVAPGVTPCACGWLIVHELNSSPPDAMSAANNILQFMV
jgi:hypothetical protein